MFNFVDGRFRQLHQELMNQFSLAAEVYAYRKEIAEAEEKKDSKEKEEALAELEMGSCINMHTLKLVELHPTTG